MNNTKILHQSTHKKTKFLHYLDHNIKFTSAALLKIYELKDHNSDNITRINISSGGCQGFQYEFKKDTIESIGQNTRDIVLYDDNELLIVVFDLFSEFYIKNSTINYISNNLEHGFKIENNPQSESSCGCKKSFHSSKEFEDDQE